MNKNFKRISTSVSFLLILLLVFSSSGKGSNNEGWKAGVARLEITPKKPMWLAGYGTRTHTSTGKLQKLWAKALALEDANGNRAIMITTDLLGFPKNISDNIRNRLQKEYNLSRGQIMLNSSHTHSGPVLRNMLVDVYPMDSLEWKKADLYSSHLEDLVVKLAAKALQSMKSAELFSGNGIVRFQVNRRNTKEPELTAQTELKGPNDYSVPVLKVSAPDGRLLAVAFGYACHATVLSGYEWCGDYPGYAQADLEKLYRGTTAMFFQGAAGDQNPLPRTSSGFAQQYGSELASSVKRVLDETMKALPPALSTAYSEIELQMESLPSKDSLLRMLNNRVEYYQRWAKRMLDMEERGETAIASYMYPLEVWSLGGQKIIAMGGEPTVEYPIKFKQMFGQDIFVFGYTNDVMGYIPSAKVLDEGGYEGDKSKIAYGLPGKWKPGIEEQILHEVKKLVKQTETTK